jgi:glycerol uptake facilitator protein
MSSPTFTQKLTAEAIGTAILVFIGAGSVPLTVFLTAGAGGTGIDGTAGLSTISFSFAFAIFAAVYSIGHISGCHINPAVTISLLVTRKIDSRTAGSYIAAQLIGAFIGAALTLIILTGNDPAALGLGAVSVNDKAGLAVGFAAEVIGTAILVFTVFGAAVSGKAPSGFAGLIIGFIVYGIIILVGPITGASLNPARELGPALLGQAIGAKPVPLDQLIVVYIFGSTIGGVVGAVLYEFIGREVPASVPATSSVRDVAADAA